MTDEKRLLEEAMAGVEPLADRPVPVVRRARPRRRAPVAAAGGRADLAGPPAPAGFELAWEGERLEGWRPGVEPALVGRLRAGEIAVDRRLDLHGHTAAEAREAVREAVSRLRHAGGRCLLVVHGRGRGSGGVAVLKRKLPGWLAEPPLGSWVIAFATPVAALGGAGATVVLLRRQRPGGRRRRRRGGGAR